MSKLTKKDLDVLDKLGIKDKNYKSYSKEDLRKIIKEKELKKKNEKRNKAKRIRKLKITFIIIIVFLIIFIPIFIFTDISKIKSVSVNGNSRVKTSVVLSLLDITPNKTFIFFDKEKTKVKLFKDPYIKNIEISQSFFYSVNVKIEEREEKYIFKGRKDYYITGDDLVYIRKTNVIEKDLILFEDFKIKKTNKAEEINVSNSFLLNNINKLIHTLNENKCSVKKIIYDKTFPLIYLTDKLYLEGRPSVINNQVKKLLQVLKKLSELKKDSGKIIIARNNYFSFKETLAPKNETKSTPTKAAIKTKEAIN